MMKLFKGFLISSLLFFACLAPALAGAPRGDNSHSLLSTANSWLQTQAFATQGLTIGGSKPVVKVNKQIFTNSGTYTACTGLLYDIVEEVGGGGGGGGTNGSAAVGGQGGAGGYTEAVLTAATVGSSQSITIGAAGTGGANTGGTGGTGGNTTFGAILTANGGTGGVGSTSTVANVNAGGAGGTASGGDINITGQNGNPGFFNNAASNQVGILNGGGNSPYGLGLGPAMIDFTGTVAATAGVAGTGYGAGGGGARGASQTGGAGTAGVEYIWEFCAQ